MARLQLVLVELGLYRKGRIASYIAVFIGLVALLFYYSWWFRDGRLYAPWLLLAFIFALFYGAFQLAGTWIIYLSANHRPRRARLPIPSSLTVDVFVTAYNENVDLVEQCLVAACNMRVKHHTWLLDDAGRPELAELAERLGSGYLSRTGNLDHKAGNINAALPRTQGDIVVIFDIDHVPDVRFLERTLGYFAAPRMGFVQVMLTFGNTDDEWVAKAASDSSLDYYNPASLGADSLGSTTLVGSNALIRRTALESIGGYQPGLAEDLATSIALHAAGWHSVYINKALAPGLAPPDLTAWFSQQFKWARGVFELFITTYWRKLGKLTLGQKLFYGVRMTYYWIGLVFTLHLLTTIGVLFSQSEATLGEFQDYLLHLLPLAAATALIRMVVLRHHAHPTLKQVMGKGGVTQWKPLLLVLGTWPVYVLAWLMALLRLPVSFLSTPKQASGQGPNVAWIWPQILAIVGIVTGMIVTQWTPGFRYYLLVLAFAALLAAGQIGVLVQARREAVTFRLNGTVADQS
jgi:cellulose synthase (UDP-forming)